jgi:kinesin family protein 2/24
MEEAKKEKEEKKAYNLASGKNVDIDFELMIEKSKFKEQMISPHQSNGEVKLAINVRKRPIFKK